MALCVRYFASHKKLEEDEASYVSINFNDEGSGAETDNTYESIKSRYFEGESRYLLVVQFFFWFLFPPLHFVML